MPYPRNALLSLHDARCIHTFSRAVRQVWLWGIDTLTGRDYSYRKEWIVQRLRQLALCFAIDICAYAVLSNHYHLVLHIAQERARTWSKEEVVQRWTALFKEPLVVQRWRANQATQAERITAEAIIERWRTRLFDISWFMRCLNEHLARRINDDDGRSGRVWDARFKSQALLDDVALLTAMAYVDLNPVRAGIAENPEESEFTSILQRVCEIRGSANPDSNTYVPLAPFRGADQASPSTVIPFRLEDYRMLLEWTSRRDTPTGTRTPALLESRGIDGTTWQSAMKLGGNVFGRAMGRLESMRRHARTLSQSWIKGLGFAQRLCPIPEPPAAYAT